jgi:hypothetical protein
MPQISIGSLEEGLRGRLADYLREAVVELEVWRQNARTTDERQALHRVTSLLGQASGELQALGQVRDAAQQSLHLSEATTG